VRSFQDRWSGGVEHYIGWLKERVEEMHRILKPTGSIFLHCDWHANAEIKVFILNKVFGEENFRNEIIWQRTTAHNTTSKKLGVLVDNILWFSKSTKFIFNPPRAKSHDDKYTDAQYKFTNEDNRRYRLHSIERNPALGIRQNLIYEYKGYIPKFGWMMEIEKLKQMDEDGKLFWNSKGTPQRKIFLDEVEKPILGNLWNDISNVQSGLEKIGYPTQKPEALLERIITMASNEGDTVLDPFVGGGTTVAVAERLRRNWIGIDQSVMAIKVTEMRLKKPQRDLLDAPFIVQLHKYDYDTLRYQDAFEFEAWIVAQFGGTPNVKQRGDLGIDGKKDGVPIQVKRSDNIGRDVIDKFQSACKRFDAKLFEKRIAEKQSVGTVIAFSFGKGAIQEVARLKNHDGVIIELVTVEAIVPIAKKPKLILTCNDLGLNAKKLREIEFVAVGESESGIEFYAWDFNHEVENGFKADVMIDKTGKQTHAFKAGNYQVAVKVVDNEGIESVEIITLKTNGILEMLV
jgi:DNA modification methylase